MNGMVHIPFLLAKTGGEWGKGAKKEPFTHG